MTQTSFVSMRVVRTLADAVQAAGVPRAAFLRSAHMDDACLERPDERLPSSKLYELMGHALDLTGDAAFALHSIETLQPDALNPLGALVVHAETLQQALASIQDHRRLLGDDATFSWHEADGKVCVRCHTPAEQPLRVRRYVAEVALAGLYRSLRRFGVASRIEQVSFAYEAPEYAHVYTRVFEGRARFEQPLSGLCWDAALLKASAPHADAELHEALSAFASRRARRLTDRAPYAARVHEALVWQRPPRDLTMPAAARRLGVSVRSLRRYLTAEGVTYGELVTSALVSLAKSSLLDERRTIAETAHELGFSDTTSFHRAFKRWTGITPSEYRRKALH